jgi:hypothetical protein
MGENVRNVQKYAGKRPFVQECAVMEAIEAENQEENWE